MVKKKSIYDSSFGESLQSKREKEDAFDRARAEKRKQGIKKTLSEQRRKDMYKKILKDFNNPSTRASTKLLRHKENIEFLESVLNDNRKWKGANSGPSHLKPNLVKLKEIIREMKLYIEKLPLIPKSELAKSDKNSLNDNQLLTPIQVSEIYSRASGKILKEYGSMLKRLSRNIRDGLPIESARDRLMSLGVAKHVTLAFDEVVLNSNLDLTSAEKDSFIKKLHNRKRISALLDDLVGE